MQLKTTEVHEVVESFARLSKNLQPTVIGLDAPQHWSRSPGPDPTKVLDRFAKFNRKGEAVYGINLQTLRYILRKPYQRFQRPVTKAFRHATSILRDHIRRQNELEARVDFLQEEIDQLRTRLARLEAIDGDRVSISPVNSNAAARSTAGRHARP